MNPDTHETTGSLPRSELRVPMPPGAKAPRVPAKYDMELTRALRSALVALERHVALNAMDRLIFDDNGEFAGWEKSPEILALLDQAREALS